MNKKVTNMENKLSQTDLDLIKACEKGNFKLAENAIKAGANSDIKDGFENTILIWATYNKYTDLVKLLISKRVNVNEKNKFGDTALNWASFKGYMEIVKLLLDNGAEECNTALNYAKEKGHKEIVELLENHINNLNKK